MCLIKLVVAFAFVMVTAQGYQRISIVGPRSKRKATTLNGRRWPDGIIPFTIDNSSVPDRDVILHAMNIWERLTCITFVELTDEKDILDENKNRVVFYRGNSCWSGVGKYGFPEQYVSLGPDCNFVHVILHEIGHVVGFEHEHKRPDRDKYVRINWLNVNKLDAYNYEKRQTLTTVPYDLYSIMHYARDTFSENGLPTVLTVDPLKQYDIGRARDLSFLDIKLANEMYKCNENCNHVDICRNGGFVGPSPNCQCVCPSGYYGDRCHFTSPPVSTGCRHRILEPSGKIKSPNFPANYNSQEDCIWYLKAKEGQTITLKFTEFDVEDSPSCTRDHFNIRTKNMYQDEEDKFYCGNRIPETVTTEGNELMLLFLSDYNIQSKGFSAEYTFNDKDKTTDIYNPNCFERSCYIFLERQSSHADAKKLCKKKGMALLMVSSFEENAFLKQLFGESLIGSSYWIDFPYNVDEREPGWEWALDWYEYIVGTNGTDCCINVVYDDWISEYCVDTEPFIICETRVPESVEPKWRQWSDWNDCTVTCGGGTKTRYRHCSLPGLCNGTSNATTECNTAKCPGSFARYKMTNQSSFVEDSWKAVDSFYWPKTSDGSCSVTEYEWEPWWVVDLGKSHTVVKLSVTIDAQRYIITDGYPPMDYEHALTLLSIQNARCCNTCGKLVVTWPDPKFINYKFQGKIECSIKSGSKFSIGQSLVTCTANTNFVTYQNICSFAVNIHVCNQKLNSSCYTLINEKHTYLESRERCRQLGFDLVNIETTEENDYVWKEMLLGLTQERCAFIAPNDKTEEDVYVLPNGENITYTNWNSFEPNNYGSGQHCAVMYKYEGKWSDEDCRFPRIAICEAPLPVPTIATGQCDHEYNGACYVAIDTKLNFKVSKKLCQAKGGQLTSIRDADENNFVSTLVKVEAYIGLTDAQKEGNWKWLSGGKPKFEKWLKNQPDNKGKGKGEDCVAIKPGGGWKDVSCKRKLRAICKIHK
ncbi:uncharacterized protein LOC117101784 isoform X2 [Anneissia japonica]|uniref:uncharacterized protein LOC117101784 isoform X2 n=1 Tax=Anneissia japonica TaxID=1529436 RepID=UPI0014256C1A|nr:uncharacterized protein LOC117101784 isoform X2 [Anneissia japonica]